MGYVLNADIPLGASLVRVVRAQVSKARRTLSDHERSSTERVHETRKALKRARAALKLAGPSLSNEGQALATELRDLGHDLGSVRDRDVVRDTLARLTGDEVSFQEARERLAGKAAKKKNTETSVDHIHTHAEVQASLAGLEERLGTWTLAVDTSTVAECMKRRHRQAKRAMARALDEPTAERLHTWRKQIKVYGHGARLLGKTWSAVFGPDVRRLDALAEVLGNERDLALVEDALKRVRDAWREPRVALALQALIREEREALWRRAKVLGKDTLAPKPRRLRHHLDALWLAPPPVVPTAPRQALRVAHRSS